jgi:protein transport protein SEC61 subunit gamma-like protein
MKLDVKSKLLEWKRILQVARKPSMEEFITSSRICTLGIIVIGAIGFAIFLAFAFLGF